jgi:hypothetical protein
MMEKFSHILQQMLKVIGTYSSRNHFGGTSPFKVQINFDIPIFEGQIDADALEKWLNLLEGYFSTHNFFNRENISFTLLKSDAGASLHVGQPTTPATSANSNRVLKRGAVLI